MLFGAQRDIIKALVYWRDITALAFHLGEFVISFGGPAGSYSLFGSSACRGDEVLSKLVVSILHFPKV